MLIKGSETKMPKTYSEEERRHIRARLHEEANICLLEYGVRKTTVDELVRRVGIPKGTFYLFYKSKELLLFEVIQDYHEEIEQEMMKRCIELGDKINVEHLTKIIVDAMLLTQKTCLKTVMIPAEMEQLIRKLPADVVAEHLELDEDTMLKLLGHFFKGKDIDAQAYSGAFRGIFFACMYPKEIGEENFRESIEVLVRGVLTQIFAICET